MRNKGKVDLFDSRGKSGGVFLSNTEEKKEDGKITVIENSSPEKPIEDLLNQVFICSLRVGMEYGKEILERTEGNPEKIMEELGDLCDTAMSILNEIKLK